MKSVLSELAANIASITLELALATFEWVFAAVDKLVFGKGAIMSTAILALVTLENENELLEGLDSNLLLSKSRSRSRSKIFAMTRFDGKCQNLQTTIYILLIFR